DQLVQLGHVRPVVLAVMQTDGARGNHGLERRRVPGKRRKLEGPVVFSGHGESPRVDSHHSSRLLPALPDSTPLRRRTYPTLWESSDSGISELPIRSSAAPTDARPVQTHHSVAAGKKSPRQVFGR